RYFEGDVLAAPSPRLCPVHLCVHSVRLSIDVFVLTADVHSLSARDVRARALLTVTVSREQRQRERRREPDCCDFGKADKHSRRFTSLLPERWTAEKFAPRSRAPSIFSNRHGLAILAPDVAQAIAYLADGGERFDAREYVRQKIFRRARGVFEERERDFGSLGVAAFAKRADALDLCA